MSDPIPPADDEPFVPLTAQQLGLCGPRSDDPGVGPDAARHTPPADDQDARARKVGQALAAAEFYDAVEDDVARVLADEVKRLQARNHEIQAQEMAKRAELDSEVARWRQRYEEAKLWTERNELRAEWASGEFSVHPFWHMTSWNARSALLRLVTERDESVARVAAARALHSEIRVDDEGYRGCVHCGGDYPCDTLQVLDGPSGLLSPAPKDSQTPAGPAEAAEPARVPACGDIMSWAGYTNVCDLPAGHEGSHQMGETTRWSRDRAIRQAVDRARAGSVTTTPDPAALALIDDLLRPWAYGYPVNPGYAGRAAQYVSVETLAGWNARRAALATSAPKENDRG